MYPRNQMPSLTTRNDTQKFIYSNICINFLRDENSTFQRIITKKKKKGESLKDVSIYGTSIQSPTLSRSTVFMNFNISSNQPFFRVSILRYDSIELEHHWCYYNFRPFEYPPRKRVGKTVDAPRCIDAIMTREKKNGVMKENSVRRAQRDLLTFIVSKRSKWRH